MVSWRPWLASMAHPTHWLRHWLGPTTCVLPFGDARLLCAAMRRCVPGKCYEVSATKTAAIRASRERSDCPKQAWIAQNEAHTMLLSTALARARDADQIMLKLWPNESTRA